MRSEESFSAVPAALKGIVHWIFYHFVSGGFSNPCNHLGVLQRERILPDGLKHKKTKKTQNCSCGVRKINL